MDRALDAVFRPGAVAVIGASADPRKRGHQAVRALVRAGYAGTVHPVNPRGGEILGLKVITAVEAVPEGVDLALVCLPADRVPAALEACAARGIRAAVVLATGFKEAGREGASLESRVREVAHRTGIRVVGPNTSGVLRPAIGLDLVGVGQVAGGHLALVVQSGNLALSLMQEAASRPGPGISAYVGVGNETDLGFHDYLEWLAADQETRAVLVYADGFRESRRFLAAAARASRTKPVLVLKSGRTRAGARAARSHTGAVSSPWALLRAGLRQAGVTVLERSDELLAVGRALAAQPPAPPGKGIAILSDGGGHGALAADALAETGAPLADLASDTQAAVRGILGRSAAVGNPVDVGGPADADPCILARVLEALLADPGVGAVLVVGLFGGYHLRFATELEGEETEAARRLAQAARRSGTPLVLHSLYAEAGGPPLDALVEAGVPLVGSLETACRCVSALTERGAALVRPWWDPSLADAGGTGGRAPIRGTGPVGGGDGAEAVGRARAEGRTMLTEPEARALAGAFGVELVAAAMCRTEEEAVGRAGPDPVVLKTVSPHILHKTEAGGVEVGVQGERAVREAFRGIRDRTLAYLATRRALSDPEAAFHGVLVAPVLPSPLAELLVGARREPGLGPVLTVGAGGTGVELFGDAAHRVLPVARDQIRGMLDELRIAGLLTGHRGGPAADLDALTALVEALVRTLLATTVLAELEANPVFCYPDRAVAVDVRAFLLEG